ncbi:MAG: CvpA family protein [Cyclobacteriaceae bacterium]
MNYLDIFFVVIFIFGLIKGYMKGLVVEVFSFIGFFAGLFAAIELTIPVSNNFFQDSQYFQFLTVAVFIVLFILVVLLMNLLGKILKKAIDITFLGFFDNILGAIASAFKVAFILSVVIWVFGSIGLHIPEEFSGSSVLYPFIEVIGPKVFDWVSRVLPFIKDMIDSLENIGDKSKSLYTFL